MRLLTKIIEKVTTTAKKAILFGALVGGVSMLSYATETTVGPTIEKAQLETVNINLEAVFAAITKADPNWVKGLPVAIEQSSITLSNDHTPILLTSYRFKLSTSEDWTDPENWEPGTSNSCGGSTIPCQVDLDLAGYPTIEAMLADFTDEQLVEFLNHPGVDAKN